MLEQQLPKHKNIPFREYVTMIWWAQSHGKFLNNFFKLGYLWPLPWAKPYYCPTSSYLFKGNFQLFLILLNFWMKTRYGVIIYGRCYIGQQISCVHVWNKKHKLQRFITNESLFKRCGAAFGFGNSSKFRNAHQFLCRYVLNHYIKRFNWLKPHQKVTQSDCMYDSPGV